FVRDVAIGQTAHSVGAEESRHVGILSSMSESILVDSRAEAGRSQPRPRQSAQRLRQVVSLRPVRCLRLLRACCWLEDLYGLVQGGSHISTGGPFDECASA